MIWIASTVTIVVLLFGYHTSTDRVATVGGGTTSNGQRSSTSSSGSSGGSPPKSQSAGQGTSQGTGSSRGTKSSSSQKSSSKKPSTKKTSTKTSVAGDVAATQWGPVQVKIIVQNKRITAVDVIQQPSGNPRDEQINSYAVPILVRETISAQSAHIDMISGATVTSGGYLQSLQSALDRAGI